MEFLGLSWTSLQDLQTRDVFTPSTCQPCRTNFGAINQLKIPAPQILKIKAKLGPECLFGSATSSHNFASTKP